MPAAQKSRDCAQCLLRFGHGSSSRSHCAASRRSVTMYGAPVRLRAAFASPDEGTVGSTGPLRHDHPGESATWAMTTHPDSRQGRPMAARSATQQTAARCWLARLRVERAVRQRRAATDSSGAGDISIQPPPGGVNRNQIGENGWASTPFVRSSISSTRQSMVQELRWVPTPRLLAQYHSG